MASKQKKLTQKRNTEKKALLDSGKKKKGKSKYARKEKNKTSNLNSPFFATNLKSRNITINGIAIKQKYIQGVS